MATRAIGATGATLVLPPFDADTCGRAGLAEILRSTCAPPDPREGVANRRFIGFGVDVAGAGTVQCNAPGIGELADQVGTTA